MVVQSRFFKGYVSFQATKKAKHRKTINGYTKSRTVLVGKLYILFLSRAYFQKPRAVMLEGSFGFTRRTGNPGMQVEPIELFEMWGDVRIQFHITIGMISHRIHVSFHEIFFKTVGLGIFRRRLWTWNVGLENIP